MVVSETNTMLLYQNTSLKWSAQLEFLPVAIKRGFFEYIKGAIVMLSEEGRLQCCYLGTEPSLFVAPPLKMSEIDFDKASEELANLNKIIRNSNNGRGGNNFYDKVVIFHILMALCLQLQI